MSVRTTPSIKDHHPYIFEHFRRSPHTFEKLLNEDNPKIIEDFSALRTFSKIFEGIWEIKNTAACLGKQSFYSQN